MSRYLDVVVPSNDQFLLFLYWAVDMDIPLPAMVVIAGMFAVVIIVWGTHVKRVQWRQIENDLEKSRPTDTPPVSEKISDGNQTLLVEAPLTRDHIRQWGQAVADDLPPRTIERYERICGNYARNSRNGLPPRK